MTFEQLELSYQASLPNHLKLTKLKLSKHTLKLTI